MFVPLHLGERSRVEGLGLLDRRPTGGAYRQLGCNLCGSSAEFEEALDAAAAAKSPADPEPLSTTDYSLTEVGRPPTGRVIDGGRTIDKWQTARVDEDKEDTKCTYHHVELLTYRQE
jgi:hypothetical protein